MTLSRAKKAERSTTDFNYQQMVIRTKGLESQIHHLTIENKALSESVFMLLLVVSFVVVSVYHCIDHYLRPRCAVSNFEAQADHAKSRVCCPVFVDDDRSLFSCAVPTRELEKAKGDLEASHKAAKESVRYNQASGRFARELATTLSGCCFRCVVSLTVSSCACACVCVRAVNCFLSALG